MPATAQQPQQATKATACLDATEAAFATGGILGLTTRRIAEHGDINTGNLYTHYENRTTLIQAMGERLHADTRNLTDRLTARLATASDQLATRIETVDIAAQYVNWMAARPAAHAMFAHRQIPPEINPEPWADITVPFTDALNDAAGDPTGLLLLVMWDGIVDAHLAGRCDDPSESAETATRIILRGVR